MLLGGLAALAAACGDDTTGPPDGAVGPPDAAPIDAVQADADMRRKLSGEGLYSDISTLAISPDAIEYAPVHELWADGALKRRWIMLPAGAQIDTSDMDHWRFPKGTKFFKQFSTPDGLRLETRLIEKTGDTDNPNDFFFCAFIWFDDQSDAACNTGGMNDVLGTMHDVPNQNRCQTCHNGEPGKVLGFQAIQLSKPAVGANDVTLKNLANGGKLTNLPMDGMGNIVDYPYPGATDAERGAMAYFHSNCAHCHNPNGSAYMDTCATDPMTGDLSQCQLLRLTVAETQLPVAQNGIYLSLVNQLTHYYPGGSGGVPRVVPGDPDASAVYVRINQRGSMDQMPPKFSTELVDTADVQSVHDWILGLQ